MTTSLPPISNEDIMDVLKEAYPELFTRRFWEVTKKVVHQITSQDEYPDISLYVDSSNSFGHYVYCVGMDRRGDKPKPIPQLVIDIPPTFYKATPDVESDIREAIKRWLELA